jgi:hypothetical protein
METSKKDAESQDNCKTDIKSQDVKKSVSTAARSKTGKERV